MRKLPIEKRSTGEHLGLVGRSKATRFSDDELADVANHPNINDVWLWDQAITKLPPFVAPTVMHLGGVPLLKSLAGIEAMVSLRTLRIDGGLVRATTFDSLAELPELVELTIHTDGVERLPSTIAKLPSLIKLTLVWQPGFDLEHACTLLAKIGSLRALTIERLQGPIPNSIGKLVNLERLKASERRVTAIPKSIGRLKRLVKLGLEGNRIRELPDELWSCTALEHLGLRYNFIKVISPKIGHLRSLRVLDLLGTYVRTLPKEVGALANLRDVRLPKSVKDLPPEVLALRLDHYLGPLADKLTLREVDTPDASELRFEDPARLPPSFGPVRSLELDWDVKTPPITQLAQTTELRSLDVRIKDLATVIPYIPPQIVELELHGVVAKLPRLVKLEKLQLQTTGPMSFAYPALRELFHIGAGPPRDLDQTRLERLFLANGAMPDVKQLAHLPLRWVVLRNMKRVKLAALCEVLEGKPIERLELDSCELRTLPAAIAKLSIRELDLRSNPLTALPAAVGRIAGLEVIELSETTVVNKRLLPGTWQRRRRGSQITLSRV